MTKVLYANNICKFLKSYLSLVLELRKHDTICIEKNHRYHPSRKDIHIFKKLSSTVTTISEGRIS